MIGLLTGPIGILLLKHWGDLKETFYGLLLLVVVLVFTSTYFSGGIYSIDLLWMIIISINCFLFVGIRGGVVMIFVAVVYFLSFYFLNMAEVKNFKAENEALGVGYILYNHIFLLLLASIITYFFVNGAEKIKSELDEVKERRVKSLGYKYRYITENANKIIGLHTNVGSVYFISPAVKQILGYEVEEMKGLGYLKVLGVFQSERQVMCKSKTGKDVWLEVTFNKIKENNESGEVIMSMARDITTKVLENRKILELRKQIANDFHEEMGNKLASITLNSNVLAENAKAEPKLMDIILKIEETSIALYQNSRDFLWFIDAKSDDLNEVFLYLSDFGQDFYRSLGIEFEVNTIGLVNGKKVELSLYSGRHIILIFKELMTNAAKHAKCKRIVLDLIVQENQFLIRLSDDGIGFDGRVKLGKGLNSIHERARTIPCAFSIDSNSLGTKAELSGHFQ